MHNYAFKALNAEYRYLQHAIFAYINAHKNLCRFDICLLNTRPN